MQLFWFMLEVINGYEPRARFVMIDWMFMQSCVYNFENIALLL